MSEKQKVKPLKQKLDELQHEEKILKHMLDDIRAEMNKFHVEQMHLKSQTMVLDDTDSEVEVQDVEQILRDIDNVNIVNKKALMLDSKTTNVRLDEEDEDSEES